MQRHGQKTCTNAKTVGNVCEFVSYQGANHSIFSTHTAEIRTSSALFMFEKILMKHGYEQETVNP